MPNLLYNFGQFIARHQLKINLDCLVCQDWDVEFKPCGCTGLSVWPFSNRTTAQKNRGCSFLNQRRSTDFMLNLSNHTLQIFRVILILYLVSQISVMSLNDKANQQLIISKYICIDFYIKFISKPNRYLKNV